MLDHCSFSLQAHLIFYYPFVHLGGERLWELSFKKQNNAIPLPRTWAWLDHWLRRPVHLPQRHHLPQLSLDRNSLAQAQFLTINSWIETVSTYLVIFTGKFKLLALMFQWDNNIWWDAEGVGLHQVVLTGNFTVLHRLREKNRFDAIHKVSGLCSYCTMKIENTTRKS